MSTFLFRPVSSIGVWSLAAVVSLVLLAGLPRLSAMAVAPTAVRGLAVVRTADVLNVDSTDRDPSVPSASSVGFSEDAGSEPAVATF